MKLLQKIFIPFIIFTVLFSNLGIDIVKHTCGETGEISISLYNDELCEDDSCLFEKTNQATSSFDVFTSERTSEITTKKTEKIVQKGAISCCENDSQVVENKDVACENKTFEKIAYNCCTNETQQLGTLVEFTITTSPKFDFNANFVIAKNIDYNLTQFNQDYEIIIEDLNRKVNEFGINIIKFIINHIGLTNQESEENSI